MLQAAFGPALAESYAQMPELITSICRTARANTMGGVNLQPVAEQKFAQNIERQIAQHPNAAGKIFKEMKSGIDAESQGTGGAF